MNNILVIEDETLIQRNLIATLEDYDYQPVSSYTGSEAIQIIYNDRSHALKVAIVDYRLPDIDGVSLIKSIHTIRPDIQYIIHTGSIEIDFAAQADQLKAVGLSPEHILYKPVLDERVFINLLEKMI